jgi:hypothetical protein
MRRKLKEEWVKEAEMGKVNGDKKWKAKDVESGICGMGMFDGGRKRKG